MRLRNGDHKHAERMLRESLELQRQSSGAADANSEIFTLQNLGSLLLIRRRYEEAAAVFNQALERADSIGDAFEAGLIRTGLALVHTRCGRPELAENELRRALALQ